MSIDGGRTITVELTEQDSAIIILSLELREMHFAPHAPADRDRLKELKKELSKKHEEAFIPVPAKRH